MRDITDPRNAVLRPLKEAIAGHVGLGAFAEAEKMCWRLLVLNPYDGQQWVRYARLLFRMGLRQNAIAAYWGAVSVFRRAQEYRHALAVCAVILELIPHDPEAVEMRRILSARKGWSSILFQSRRRWRERGLHRGTPRTGSAPQPLIALTPRSVPKAFLPASAFRRPSHEWPGSR